jgi:hypothetical protein
MTDLLQQIQQMQFDDRSAAEALLVDFVRDTFPLDVARVELRPLAVSLNSFNGFLHLTDGERLFFKTHTESDNVIGEYYRAGLLSDAGYPVIQPKFSSTEAGKHLLIYDVIEDPSVFDVAWAIETKDANDLELLTNAQQRADDDLLRLYQETLADQTVEDAADAPIHQLFHLRLSRGRMERFYGYSSDGRYVHEVDIRLPGELGIATFQQMSQLQWQINGQHYSETLADVITRVLHLLEPAQGGPSIVGHGDAHNGNVFWLRGDTPSHLLYFDPAFAGRHHPLLDLTKPLFHNVFAMWMYYPQEKRDSMQIRLSQNGSIWEVEHDYYLPSVRNMFLDSKVQRVLVPILAQLANRGMLRTDWRDYLKAALFCCPFLTMNLVDADRFPPEITLLGLTMCMEMGSESEGERSRIDLLLDEVEAALR